ncbi:ABC-2 type transport system permease protein [Ammoniphilus resinae]|uniref:ABC-2 type transport system permease protein n=2 Tax=Ammoniphilus resinae TaxID=861532 RepID=A0ABS4GN41_9BACL|nr:ABC-2 type transport system permease protein [Ammoniphilus resinae]
MKAKLISPFWVMVRKEMADHMRSWRYNLMLLLIGLTCLGSLYTAMMSIREAVPKDQTLNAFLFLKLFTVSDGTLPPFITFIGFLGPLLGISLGFDAVNSERNKGTLSRVMAQPIHRDFLIGAKFVGALILISMMFLSLGFLVMGLGLLAIGIPPSAEEFLRMLLFLLLSIIYVGFWLSLAILFSIKFRQSATSALSSLSIWLFFSVFFTMLIQLIANATAPVNATNPNDILQHQQFIQVIMSLSPSQLFSEATTTLLTPTVRSLGPLTLEQVYGAIPSPLPLGQSMLLIWPQVTGMIAATLVCFGISYAYFMRQEIRSR